jgi:uncharacterized protein (DUF433 family)
MMPQLQQLVKEFAELNPAEREELVFTLLEKLSVSRSPLLSWPLSTVVKTPGVCGGAARMIRTRIPVWVIERMRQLGLSEIDILRSYPSLRAEDLVQAGWYADSHQAEIEQAIRENEEE